MSHQLNTIAVAGLVLAAFVLPAQAQTAAKPKTEKPEYAAGGLYKCTDTDGGVTYTNTGTVKGCKKMESDKINTVSLPRSGPTTGSKTEGSALRARETDRRRILEDELTAEQKRLDDLKKEFNSGEPERQGGERNYQNYLDRTEKLKADVARGEANVDSLKREIGTLKN